MTIRGPAKPAWRREAARRRVAQDAVVPGDVVEAGAVRRET